MVEYQEQALDATFSALSDHTRRGILARLATGDLSVTEIAAPYAMSLAAVSKHLGVLARAGLIEQHKEGRVRRCHLRPEALKGAAEWIDFYQRFWEESLDSLGSYLDGLKDENAKPEDSNKEKRK